MEDEKKTTPLNELTPKQEKFIQNIVSGMSQREAYKDAYNAENMKVETIDAEACKLFNNHKISTRYRELLEELKDKAIMTAQERMKWLTEVINDIQREECRIKTPDQEEIVFGMKNADLNTKMKAIDILNKMDGQYVTKVEGSLDVTNTKFDEICSQVGGEGLNE